MNALIVEDSDNVAVAIETVCAGATIEYLRHDGMPCTLVAIDDIPAYHKVAVEDIAADQDIVKYGECIGRAAVNIARGSHVHTHNVADLN